MIDKFDNPWRTHSSRIVYDNPWIEVRHEEVTQPDGQPGVYGVVHFKSRAVGILPIDDEGHTYLVGQYRYTLKSYSWEIPEGGSPEGETTLETAKRELLEEVGLEARSWQLLGRSHLSNSVTDEEGFYFLATDLVERVAQPEGTERLEIRQVPFAEAHRMVREGEITDSLSVIAILRYAELVG
jgi:8-oxo-dGTP pyrophosphatase MutT (NUDIX family)